MALLREDTVALFDADGHPTKERRRLATMLQDAWARANGPMRYDKQVRAQASTDGTVPAIIVRLMKQESGLSARLLPLWGDGNAAGMSLDPGRCVAARKGMMASNEGSQAGQSWHVFAGNPPVPVEHTGSSRVTQEIASAGPSGRPPAPSALQAPGRSRKTDLVEFRRALFSATPHVVTTPILALACVAVYGLMVASGVPWLWPSGAQLIKWGANEGARIILRHEYWRLVAMVFVHGGLIHLLVNMSSLLVIGPLVERLYGSVTFGLIYLVAGVGGALASVGSSPLRVSVGASGAICGVLGALFAFLLVHRRTVPMSVRKPLLVNILATIIFMAILGAIVPNIDQEAHLGGLLTGFVCGVLLARPWPVVRRRSTSVRRLAATVAIAAAIAAAVVIITRTGVGALPPVSKFQDLAAQLAPALDEYNAILEAMPSTLALSRDRDDQTARPRHAQRVERVDRTGSTQPGADAHCRHS